LVVVGGGNARENEINNVCVCVRVRVMDNCGDGVCVCKVKKRRGVCGV